jgi:hypothetical protein
MTKSILCSSVLFTFTLILKRGNFGKFACEAGCSFENVRDDQPDGLEKTLTFSTGLSGPAHTRKGKIPLRVWAGPAVVL